MLMAERGSVLEDDSSDQLVQFDANMHSFQEDTARMSSSISATHVDKVSKVKFTTGHTEDSMSAKTVESALKINNPLPWPKLQIGKSD